MIGNTIRYRGGGGQEGEGVDIHQISEQIVRPECEIETASCYRRGRAYLVKT